MAAEARPQGVTSTRGKTPPAEPAPRERSEAEPLQLTLQAAAQIRGLIIDHVLLPGEKILQVELAERIGVSRSPLREALRTLESEGVVAYEINRGYVVARLDDDDLAQIYRMRELLEDELLRTVRRPDPAVLSELKDLNDKMMISIDERNVSEVLRYNRDFHFRIFDLDGAGPYVRERFVEIFPEPLWNFLAVP